MFSWSDKRAIALQERNELVVLHKHIDSYNSQIREVRSFTERLKKKWYSFAPQERTEMARLTHEVLSDVYEKKPSHLGFSSGFSSAWINVHRLLYNTLVWITSSKDYRREFNELNIELQEARINLDEAWKECVEYIVSFIALEQVSLFYELINPIKIAEFVKQDNQAKALMIALIDAAQKVSEYFNSNEINKISLELIDFLDTYDEQSLIIYIHSTLETQLAYEKLISFKEDVWIDFAKNLLLNLLFKISIDIVYDI